MSVRGGVLWKEGADTCVFKPAVRCEGETEREPDAVSRIVNTTQAGRDLEVETLIRTAFPDLVERNLVTVHTRSCVPEYDDEDMAFDKKFQPASDGGCAKLDDMGGLGVYKAHTNMITPLRGVTFLNFLGTKPNFKPLWKSMLSSILEASLTLVSDTGPWVIHTDCHLNNVLTLSNGETEAPTLSLADWGRSLIIKNPKDIVSVRQGIREWAESISYLGIDKTTPDERLGTLIYGRLGDYPQHPKFITEAFLFIFGKNENYQKEGINILRTWLPYVLISQTMGRCQPGNNSMFLNDLYEKSSKATSQEELGSVLFTALYSNQEGGMYFPTKYFKGLSTRKTRRRKGELTRRAKMSFKDPKAYVPFKTDKGVKTRKSSYTERFHRKYPGVTSMPGIAKATGIPKSILDQVYDRGMAAWRTGHRPGASQQAWGMARVYSFALKGKTYRTADADLARKTSQGK